MGVSSLVAAGVVRASEDPNCHLVPWGNNPECGFPAPTADIFNFDSYYTFAVAGQEFNFTKPVILAIIGSIFLIVFFVAVFRKPKLVPGRMQSVGEYGYTFIRDGIAREVIGEEGDRYVPFLFSLFFFVWMLNIWGIIPFAQFPVSSRIAWPAALAIIIWPMYMYLGMRHQGPIKFFKDMLFPPGLPWPIYFILAPIELISTVIIRPATLTIRLFANMFAGHLLLTIFAVATFYLISPSIIGLLGSAASFAMSVVLTGFEAFIQALQAFIFTLLAAVYISTSLHAEH